MSKARCRFALTPALAVFLSCAAVGPADAETARPDAGAGDSVLAVGAVPEGSTGLAAYVTIEVDEICLSDVVRLVAGLAGVRFEITPRVQAELDAETVSVNLAHAPWRPALGAILQPYGLNVAGTASGNVFRIVRSTNAPAPAVWTNPAAIPAVTVDPGWDIADLLATVPPVLCGVALVVLVALFVFTLVRRVRARRVDGLFACLAVVAGWSLCLAACFCYGMITVALLVWRGCRDGGQGWDAEHARLYAPFEMGSVLAVVLFGLCIMLARWARTWARDDGRRWAAIALTISMIPLLFVVIDAPPLGSDHRWEDLPTPPTQAVESYACLERLTALPCLQTVEPNLPGIWHVDQFTNALAHSSAVTRAWAGIEEARGVLAELDGFASIADLETFPDYASGVTNSRPSRMAIPRLARVYRAYVLLNAFRGNWAESVRDLELLHSIARKALPHSRTLVSKLTWVSIAGHCVKIGDFVSRTPGVDRSVHQRLAEAFPPIPAESFSLSTPFIADYVLERGLIADTGRGHLFDLFDLFRMEEWTDGHRVQRRRVRVRDALRPLASRVTGCVLFNPNRTIRDRRAYLDIVVDVVSRTPSDYAEIDAFLDGYVARPRIRNLGGQVWFLMSVPSFDMAKKTVDKVKIKSDLLAIRLHRLCGEAIFLTDPCTGKRYHVDRKTKEPICAGPDKVIGTADDITLATE